MKKPRSRADAPEKKRRGNVIAFPADAFRPLDIAALRAAVEREIATANASAALIILYNEFQGLLGEDARDWRSSRYRGSDLN